MEKEVHFQKGFYEFHEDVNFNFQLNRVVFWDGGDAEDIRRISGSITDSKSWTEQMKVLARQAELEGRGKEAVAYWRMSEFFLYDGEPEKAEIYKKAAEMFRQVYGEYFEDGTVEQYEVPFEGGFLPVMRTSASGERKGCILLHGGNDSYYEELFFPMLYLGQRGYEVYLFEGPGQGGVLRLQNMKFRADWEVPTGAVLDYFQLEDVTIIGASLGGYLAPRAAAFDKRISRVVGWSIFPDFFKVILSDHPPVVTRIMDRVFRMGLTGPLNAFYKKMMKENELVRWNLSHGMYAYGAADPCDYIRKIRKFTLEGIGDKIDQDVLIIGAREDHFIYPRLFHEEYDLLKNVRSLTFHLLTNRQDAGAHCNIGNSRLVLDIMADWIARNSQPT